jgi:hypothetical protein
MCFFAWSDHVYLVAAGLDRKRWGGPRKYEVRLTPNNKQHFEVSKIVIKNHRTNRPLSMKTFPLTLLNDFAGSVQPEARAEFRTHPPD